MTIASMGSAKAQQTADNIANKIPPKEQYGIARQLDDAKDQASLQKVLDSVKALYKAGKVDMSTDENIPEPAGYQEINVNQREDWNAFLNYLNKKRLRGKSILDQIPSSNDKEAKALKNTYKDDPKYSKEGGDQKDTRGMIELKAFLKANPESSLADFNNIYALVKSVQYEQKLLRKGTHFPTLTPFELKALQTFFHRNETPFMLFQTSDTDAKAGQYTSAEYYPVFGDDPGTTDYKRIMHNLYKSLVIRFGIKELDFNGKKVDITKL